MVYCTHKSKGCEWQGKLVELDNHLTCSDEPSSCPFVKLKCLYCEEYFYRGAIKDHEQECTFKPVVCSYCEDHKDTIYKLQSQHYEECPKYPVPCPNNCGTEPLRKDIVEHVNEACPLTMLECPFQYSGYVCSAKMARCEMPGHADMETHLCMAAIKIKELEEENASLKAQLNSGPNKELKEESDDSLIAQLSLKSAEVVSSRRSESTPKVIDYLTVTNLPLEANLWMLQSVFGQYGLVQKIKMKGGRCAHVRYFHEHSAHAAITHSDTKGIRLKSVRLHVVPVFKQE